MTYEELRARAAEALPKAAFAYYDGTAGDGQSGAEATLAWRSHRLRPHVLRDVAVVDTTTTVGGLGLPMPVLVAPSALHGLACEGAERETVAGAYAGGALPVISTRASLPLEDMGLLPGRWWMQLYVLQDRGLTRELARRAVDLGAAALVVTGDAPVVSRRPADRGALPAASLRTVPGVRPGESGSALVDGEQARDATFADVEELVALAPVWVKGVLRADDAQAAADAGATGVIVSNHGGRQLDGAVATALALPAVVAAFPGEVLVDGGITAGATL